MNDSVHRAMKRFFAQRLAFAVLTIAGILFATQAAWAQSPFSWNSASGGNWSDTSATGWNNANYPSAVGDFATASQNVTSDQTITINVTDATVGTLRLRDASGPFGSFQNWIIATSDATNNKLTFDASSGNAVLESGNSNVGAGNTISAPIVLNDSLTITGNSVLMTISGVISEGAAGKGLLYQNSGGLTLSGASPNSYSGGTVITSGGITVGAASSLGSNVVENNVSVTNARLILGTASNIGSNQTLTINTTNTLSSGRISVLGLPSNALPAGLVAPTTAIVLGINTTGFTAVSDLATFGAGNSFLGSTTTGSYTGASLGVGTGSTYRLGGGGGTLTVTNGVLTGGTALTVGVGNETGLAVVNGAGTVVLQGANGYTGATLVNPGSTLTLNTAAGAIASSSGVTVNFGTLNLDNTAGNLDRIGNTAGVTLRGSTLALTHNAATDTTETVGTLAFGSGFGSGKSTVTLTTATNRVTTLAAAGISRADNATALIRGTSLGSTATNSTKVTLASTAGLTQIGTTAASGGAGSTTNLKIVPWILADTVATGLGSNFATYDATQGFRPLGASETVTFAALSAADQNVRGAGTSLGSTATMNSLFLTGPSGTNLTGTSGVSLNVTSGGVALAGSSVGVTISGFDAVNLGTASNKEAIIHSTAEPTFVSNLIISSTINPGTDFGLTKSGAGTVTLGSGTGDTVANTYTGVTTINEGVLNLKQGQ